MKSWPVRAALLAATGGLLLAIPAVGQDRDDPESLLPPGFESPPPEPQDPAPAPSDRPAPAARDPGPTSSAPQRPGTARESEEEEERDPLDRPRPLNYFTVPGGLERPVDLIGVLQPGHFGVGADAFGRSNGGYLVSLMNDLDAPVASRWASILLRRVLMSRLRAPAGTDPVNWVGVRADLLLRMGEADGARMLVQSIDQSEFTPRFIEAAARTALATGDPGAMCPLVGPASSRETVWKLAEAMCAALEGESARASALADEARRRGDIANVDYLLAEKLIGATAETRRAATIEWDEVDQLTPWRVGLATATGAEVPARLVSAADPAIQAWLARAPMLPLEQRHNAAAMAAAIGVMSSSNLVDIYSLVLDQTDPAEAAGTVGARLQTAWAGRNAATRMAAMRELWRQPETLHERYARLILTASAAARIAPSSDFAADADSLIASMLAGGLDRPAARWADIVTDGGNVNGWALLAVGGPRGAVDVSRSTIDAYVETDDADRRRSQMLVAALAGLGRIEASDYSALSEALGIGAGSGSRWGTAIDRAAQAREPGTVALLAAVAMQTRDWEAVPPQYLFRLVRALRTVGLEFEARMIAAEAITRL
jgi:hypothetical protein